MTNNFMQLLVMICNHCISTLLQNYLHEMVWCI